MPIAVLDIDPPRAELAASPPDTGPRIVSHNGGCCVVQHYHSWQPARYPRCSARFWCASCRVWFYGGRCYPDRYR
jgi:hypothetical protein